MSPLHLLVGCALIGGWTTSVDAREPDEPPTDRPTHIAVAADGSRAVLARENGQVELLDPAAPEDELRRTILEPLLAAEPWELALSPDGGHLAALDDMGELTLWALGAQTPAIRRDLDFPWRGRMEGYDFGSTLAWSPDGTRLAAAVRHGTARLVDSAGQVLAAWDIQKASGSPPLVWSLEGRHLITAFDERVEARLGETGGPAPVQSWPPVECGAVVDGLAHHPQRPLLAIGLRDTRLLVLDLETRETLLEHRMVGNLGDRWGFQGNEHASMLAFSPDGSMLAASTVHAVWVEILDLATGEIVFESDHLGAHFGEPHEIAWSPDSKCLWSAYSCGGGRVLAHPLDPDTPSPLGHFRGPVPCFGAGLGLGLLRTDYQDVARGVEDSTRVQRLFPLPK